MALAGRFRELLKKYGKVALGVHLSVSAASITGIYIAVENNVDVESLLERVGLSSKRQEGTQQPDAAISHGEADLVFVEDEHWTDGGRVVRKTERRNRTAELAASSGGALAVAVLLNKALFPVRVPITIALTPPIARFLARKNIIKGHV